ncbi:MAG: hypothetical protein AAF547_04535 [Actinomycetota bacterium]
MEDVSEQFVALRERLAAVPVIKSGLSLMTGTMLTSALGLVFWVIAARLYEPAAFGVSTTAVYTMIMLADVACIGLRTGLVRYIPQAGRATTRTIVWGYALVTTAATVTAGIFLIGLGWWAPDLTELRNSILVVGFFILSTAFWALFMLEDAVLVGLRKAPWVPIENTLFGILKIILLFPMASLSPSLGVFWAWTLPVFPIVIGINVGVRRVAQRKVRAARRAGERRRPSMRALLTEILAFSLADWFAAVARLAALGVIPLMVLAEVGKVEAGYFQAAWLIAFTIFALSMNAAYALLAESSYEKNSLHRNSIQAGLLSLALTLPVILVGVVGAPYLLLIYGQEFADNSASVLRILLLAAIPNIAHQIYVGRLRSQSRMGWVVFLETLLSVLVVVLAAALLPRYGIDGVGYAWLIGLSALALYAIVAETVWWWAARLDARLVRAVGVLVGLSRPDRPARGMEGRLSRFQDRTGLAGVETHWRPSVKDRQVAIIGNGMERETVVEFARTSAGAEELVRRRTGLEALHRDRRLHDVHRLVPVVRDHDETPGREYLALEQPVGPSARALLASGVDRTEVCRHALWGLRPLRDATGRVVLVGAEDLDRWIEAPLEHLRTVGRASADQLEELQHRLFVDLVGLPLPVGTIHGELGLDNIILGTGPSRPGGPGGLHLRGYCRWDQSCDAPFVVDAATLAMSDLVTQRRRELGDVTASLLRDPAPFEAHPAMQSAAVEGWGSGGYTGPVQARAVLLLAWLFQVGSPLPPGRTVSSDGVWLARNAQPVLALLDDVLEFQP